MTLRSVPRLAATATLLALSTLWLASSGFASSDDEDAGSRIEFVGKNLIATADGTFHEWKITGASVDFERLAESWVEIEIDVASVDTGIGRRDDHLRTDDFFDVGTFPTATVRVHGAKPAGESEAGYPRYTAQFDIRIRDVEKTLEAEFELVSDSPRRVEGGLTLLRTDFGVGAPASRWNPMGVRHEIPVRFSAVIP